MCRRLFKVRLRLRLLLLRGFIAIIIMLLPYYLMVVKPPFEWLLIALRWQKIKDL